MKKNRRHKLTFKKTLPGFSLIEMAIVISILGLLLTGVFKGKQLYDNAKLNALIGQIQDIQLSIHQFEQNYGALPGDFAKASEQIKDDLINGNGDGKVESSESKNVWPHLFAAKLFPSSTAPVSKMGGIISFEHTPNGAPDGHWIIVGKPTSSNNSGAILTPEQAFLIDKKIDNGIGNSGKVRGIDGEDGKGSCLKSDGSYNLTNKDPSCVLIVEYP